MLLVLNSICIAVSSIGWAMDEKTAMVSIKLCLIVYMHINLFNKASVTNTTNSPKQITWIVVKEFVCCPYRDVCSSLYQAQNIIGKKEDMLFPSKNYPFAYYQLCSCILVTYLDTD